MNDSTASASGFKCGPHLKPRPSFPLTAHPSFRWCKKHRGRTYYFGPIDPEAADYGAAAALAEYEEQWPGISSSESKERPKANPYEILVKELGNLYVNAQRKRLELGHLAPRSFADSKAACDLAVTHLGKDTRVDDLRPEDFERLRDWMLARWKGVRVNNYVCRVRSVFNWGVKNHVLTRPPLYGDVFSMVPKRVLKSERRARGRKFFESNEIRLLLAEADPQMRAAILLGINAALGNADISRLKHASIKNGWLDYPRAKTAVERLIPLWPETLAAIANVKTMGVKPKSKADRGLVFLTSDGEPWGVDGTNQVAHLFTTQQRRIDAKLAAEAEKAGQSPPERINQKFRGFYSLRHTTYTVIRRHDVEAAKRILGHEIDQADVGEVFYNEDAFPRDRLQAAVDFVHDWLWPAESADSEATEGGEA